jgi:bacterioferritin-associated ferredoxin
LTDKKEGFFGRLFGSGSGCGCCSVKIEEVQEDESVNKESAPEEKKEN